jgi:hypothetical protein
MPSAKTKEKRQGLAPKKISATTFRSPGRCADAIFRESRLGSQAGDQDFTGLPLIWVLWTAHGIGPACPRIPERSDDESNPS